MPALTYPTGSKSLIRELNRSAVLALIRHEGPIPRVAIARRLRLSGAAVTSIAGELTSLGLIREVAQAPSTGGRRPTLLALNPTAASVIGVKLAPDHLAAVIVDLDGGILDSRTLPLSTRQFESTVGTIEALVAELCGMTSPRRVLGVGVGMPGVVDRARGIGVDAPILGWRGAPIGDLLADRLGLPVVVDNDVNTLAVAELLYGQGRDVGDFVTITIGRGVGAAIVIGGQLYRGRLGGAGEFGHVPLEPTGPACVCGRRGCLEAFVADPALISRARAAGVIGPRQGVEQLVQRADDGNAAARDLLGEAGERLGMAIAGLVNILSPALVIVSGEGMRARSHLEPRLRAAMERHVFPPLTGVELVVDPWDDTKWARGAAALALETFFGVGRDGETNGRGIDLASFAREAG